MDRRLSEAWTGWLRRFPAPQIAWRPLWLIALALAPSLHLFVLGGDAVYLKETLVAVYLMIVINRVGPCATQVLLQAALVAMSILDFVLAEPHTVVFVLLCAVYAAFSIGIGQLGENRKSWRLTPFYPRSFSTASWRPRRTQSKSG